MNKLANYLVEQLLQELNQGVTVMLPGGFKPPHAGHLQLAKKYATLPNVSEVTILIGPKERDGITMKQSMDIWKLLLAGASGIKVEQAPNDNPMRAAYEFIEKAAPGTYALGSSSKGKDYERVKMFVAGHADASGTAPAGKYNRPNVSVVELPVNTSPMLYQGRTDELNGQGISASTLRQDLAAGDFTNFKTNYPGVSETVVASIYKILNGNQNQQLSEAVISDYVQKLKVRFKAFLLSIKKEGQETKKAFALLLQAASGKKQLTQQEKEQVGNQMKDSLKAVGLVAASILPGGTIYFILIRLLKLEKYTMPSSFISKNAASAGIATSLLEYEWKPITEKTTPKSKVALKENAAVMAAMAASTGFMLAKKQGNFNSQNWSFDPIGWFKDFLKDRKLQKIADRLVQDPEIQKLVKDRTFLDKNNKITATQNLNGIQSILKNKLKPEEMQYLRYGWGPRLRKAMKLTEGRQILKEGGAAGHMSHPFDDLDLTFNDASKMIDAALSGEVEFAQEKLDGQNLMVTYKDGKVRAARNKGQLKDFAANSITADQLNQMMDGKGAVQTAFVEAMNDMESAINRLNSTQKEEFFQNGKKFVNFEVLYPGTTNVVPYGATQLRLHGFKEYDKDGNVVDEDSESAIALQKAIEAVQASTQKTYEIRVTDPITLNKTADYEKQKQELLGQLDTIRKSYNLGEQEKMSTYFQAWWKAFIEQKAKELGYQVPDNSLQLLIGRWGFGDKSTNIKALRAGISNQDFLNWVDQFDKNGVAAQQKEAKRPLENLFLKLGVYVLQNIQQLVAINPNDSMQKMRDELALSIRTIRAAAASPEMQDDDKSLQFLKRELQRVKDLGGFSAIVPTEGVVFKYNGKLYKLTGAFAPINQIIGYLKFQR
jgi:hypothetical protein